MRCTTSAPGCACPWCGAPLEPLVVPPPDFLAGSGRGRPVTIGYRRCSCSGAAQAAERERREEEARASDRARRSRREALAKAGIRPRYLNARHELAAEVVEACRRRRNVYVWGEVGTGKTTLASAAAMAMVDSPQFKRVLFATTVEVLDAIKATFGGRERGDPLGPYKQASVLLLDDLGKEVPTDWAVEKLFDLVNERYNNLLPTVVTTQYGPEALVERIARRGGEENAVAVVSRLRNKADGAAIIHLEGRDRRTTCAEGGAR